VLSGFEGLLEIGLVGVEVMAASTIRYTGAAETAANYHNI